MQDIKKPHSRSKSDNDINSRVEQFEKRSYLLKKEREEERSDEKYNKIPIKINKKNRSDSIHIRRKSGTSFGTWVFIGFVLLLVTIVCLLSFVFNSATITYKPKYSDIDLNNQNKNFTFNLQGTTGAVHFVIATTTITKTQVLPLSESKAVQSKASGKIIVYNKFDSSPQKLIKNTRFESSAGKIYRINQSITIPGKNGDTPGSVEVTVYADSYGSDYNSDPTDFTIPGFKGSPRYTGFFARSDGALTGGASGNASIASQTDINSAKDELALELTQELKTALKKTTMNGYLGLYDNIQVKFADNEADLKVGNASTYQVTATGILMFVDKKELATEIAKTLPTERYTNEDVRLDNSDKLKFSLKDSADIESTNSIDVLVEGNPRIVWTTNVEILKQKLIGHNKADFTKVMHDTSSIDSAEINFSPLWLSTFPGAENKIKFVEQIGKN